MASKKHRKKLKDKYANKKPIKMYLIDRERVLQYLKTRPYEMIKGQEIIDNTNLYNSSIGSLSQTIKAINYYTDEHIESFKGKNGGYMYYA